MSRKVLNILLIIVFLFLGILLIYSTKNHLQAYRVNNNVVIAKVISLVKDKYPEVNEKELIDILNDSSVDNEFFLGYGIFIDSDDISKSSNGILLNMYKINLLLILLLIVLVLALFNYYVYRNNKSIRKLIYYVEEINKKNYKLDMMSNGENELSILQNEIYKTMVMLREHADNSLDDKKKLKDSLSDISHQLKTPLTSIGIMLDNIIDNPDMEENLRNDFILNMKREIININFLVYNILKLSLFDTNTVKFKREKVMIKEVIDESISNVALLADLKNIDIVFLGDKEDFLYGDFRWEVEAITNILKNSIEHSKMDSDVTVKVLSSELFCEVSIIDKGCGIAKKDIKNIFKRFNKLNDNDSGFGIGLSLAKEIIEADNGRIKVKSEVGKGTSFIIRYMK